jgi:hypothetical protein
VSKRRCIDHSDRPCPRRPQPSRAHIILCARGPYYECNMAGLCSSPGGRHPIKSSLHRMQVLGPSNALLPTGAFYHLSPRARIYSLCSWSILLTQWPGLGSSPGVRHPLSCLSVSPRIRAISPPLAVEDGGHERLRREARASHDACPAAAQGKWTPSWIPAERGLLPRLPHGGEAPDLRMARPRGGPAGLSLFEHDSKGLRRLRWLSLRQLVHPRAGQRRRARHVCEAKAKRGTRSPAVLLHTLKATTHRVYPEPIGLTF